MANKIAAACLLALGILLLVSAESCSGFGPQNTVRPGDNASLHDSTCSGDDDCALLSVDCCECNMGGKQKAVLKSAVKDIVAARVQACGEIMCAAVISTDPSCAMTAACQNGACVLK